MYPPGGEPDPQYTVAFDGDTGFSLTTAVVVAVLAAAGVAEVDMETAWKNAGRITGVARMMVAVAIGDIHHDARSGGTTRVHVEESNRRIIMILRTIINKGMLLGDHKDDG